MPSFRFTVILAIAACLAGGLATVQLANNNLGFLLGSPPRNVGEFLYTGPDFNKSVHSVTITNSTGEKAEFLKRGGIWLMQNPIRDRADYRNLQRLVYFSQHLRVEDVMRRQDTTLEEAGMRATSTHAGRFHITLEDQGGKVLADYRLGRRTAWHRLNDKDNALVETFFVRPNEKSRKDHIYVCSVPDKIQPGIRQILDRGLGRLRDHRPFLFDKTGLAEITIRNGENEIVLQRPRPRALWSMAKPLESRTKMETINGLIIGLSELEAVQLHRKESITIPPRPPDGFFLEIQIVRFGANGVRDPSPTTMTVEPPASPDAATVYASIDSRPDLVFEIPFKPVEGRLTLAQLPLTVDQLRGRTLANLDIRNLDTVTIHELTRPKPIQIYLGKSGGRARWMLRRGDEATPANEIAMANLLEGITRSEVLSFASDAAGPGNLADFGLSPPQKRLVLTGGTDESIDLFFGRGLDGRFYAMRRGSRTVAEVDAATYTAVAAAPHDWRDSLLMPFSIIDLAILRIERPLRPPLLDPTLTLKYDFVLESWEGRQFGEDVTPALNTHQANRFIRFMEELRVERWLGENSPGAERALRDPTFSLLAMFRQVDDGGQLVGMRQSALKIAPASRSRGNRFYYGRLAGDSNYFVLSRETYRELTQPLLDTAESNPSPPAN